MASGIQIFKQDGSLKLDTQDRLARVVQRGTGNFTIGWPTSVSITVPGLVRDGTWAVFITTVVTEEIGGPNIFNGYFTITNNMSYGTPTRFDYVVIRR